MSFDYGSAMVSPRGFANEGVYVYGNKKIMDTIFKSVDYSTGARWYDYNQHRTLENAKKAAIKKSKNSGDAVTENFTSVMLGIDYLAY